jgi:hypothetical protein
MHAPLFARLDRLFDRFCSIGTPPDASEAFVGRMRAEQLRIFRRLTPVMMLGNILNVVILYVVFFTRTNVIVLSVWAFLSIALALFGLYGWYASRARPPRQTATLRPIKRATLNAALAALIWMYSSFLFSRTSAIARCWSLLRSPPA